MGSIKDMGTWGGKAFVVATVILFGYFQNLYADEESLTASGLAFDKITGVRKLGNSSVTIVEGTLTDNDRGKVGVTAWLPGTDSECFALAQKAIAEKHGLVIRGEGGQDGEKFHFGYNTDCQENPSDGFRSTQN